MNIIGCDFHARFQLIAMLDTETGEYTQRRLEHASAEAQAFYATLPGPALVGIESSGYAAGAPAFSVRDADARQERVAGRDHESGSVSQPPVVDDARSGGAGRLAARSCPGAACSCPTYV